MAKKNTARATPMKAPKEYVWEVAVTNEGKIDRVEVICVKFEGDLDNLRAYDKDGLCAEFRDWVYYLKIDEVAVAQEKEPVSMDGIKLPCSWGKVNERDF